MIRPAGVGVSIVAGERDILLWHEIAGTVETLTVPLVEEGCRLIEGGCAPDGTPLIGSLGPDAAEGAGQLLRVSGDGSHTVLLPTVTVSNGIGFSPDGTRAYHADSPTGRVDVFTVTDTHELVERRPFVAIAEEDGAPDGLWIDADGGIWVALYGGSRVQRYLPSGSADETVPIPARQVTSCTFGGPDLKTLYATTSRQNLAEGDGPARRQRLLRRGRHQGDAGHGIQAGAHRVIRPAINNNTNRRSTR